MSDKSIEIVEGGAADAAKPKSKKKLFIFAGAGAVLLLGGGGTGFFLMSGSGSAAEASSAEGGDHAEAEGDHGKGGDEAEEGGSSYVDVPAMVVNLRSPDGAPRFLKLHFMLVPGPNGSADKITETIPVILDAFQPFLRELRPEDLAGSAAVFRIKEELLSRAAEVSGEGVIEDVLIQDMIQQ